MKTIRDIPERILDPEDLDIDPVEDEDRMYQNAECFREGEAESRLRDQRNRLLDMFYRYRGDTNGRIAAVNLRLAKAIAALDGMPELQTKKSEYGGHMLFSFDGAYWWSAPDVAADAYYKLKGTKA